MDVSKELERMAATSKERHAVYKNSDELFENVMVALFPEPVVLSSKEDHRLWNLFVLKITKLCRFVASDLTHLDSIHDDAVYSAMIEKVLNGRKEWEPIEIEGALEFGGDITIAIGAPLNLIFDKAFKNCKNIIITSLGTDKLYHCKIIKTLAKLGTNPPTITYTLKEFK